MANKMVFEDVREKLGFQRCKKFVVGADAMHMEVHKYFMSINIQIMELYGMSESSGPHTLNVIQPDGWKVGSCGRPIRGVQLKICKPNDNGEGEVSLEGIIRGHVTYIHTNANNRIQKQLQNILFLSILRYDCK